MAITYKHLAANHPLLATNAVVANRDGSYTLQLSNTLHVVSPGKATVNGVQYYRLQNHLYYAQGEWSAIGTRQQQQTVGSKTGITLTSNLELLPEAPPGYMLPPLWDEPQKSFAVANVYQDCLGMCFAVTMARVKKAYMDSVGVNALSLSLRGQDYNISGTGTVNKAAIPNTYFGYGVGGALAAKGYARLVTNDEVWNGALQEGALLQYWWGDDPAMVNKQNNDLSGHSIIFKSYLFDEQGNIFGFKHYDYHGIYRETIKANVGKVFFGANLRDRKL